MAKSSTDESPPEKALYQADPPQDLLEQIGTRSEAHDLLAWDAVAAYARARLASGPDVDLSDPAILPAGPWHDAVQLLGAVEHKAPVLRPTG